MKHIGEKKLRKLRLSTGGAPVLSKSRNSRNAGVFHEPCRRFGLFRDAMDSFFTYCVLEGNMARTATWHWQCSLVAAKCCNDDASYRKSSAWRGSW
jgi:hypothetical protein